MNLLSVNMNCFYNYIHNIFLTVVWLKVINLFQETIPGYVFNIAFQLVHLVERYLINSNYVQNCCIRVQLGTGELGQQFI